MRPWPSAPRIWRVRRPRHGRGLQIRRDKIEPFTNAFVDLANRTLTAKDLEPSLRLDAEIGLCDLPDSLVHELQRLQPFGMGNPSRNSHPAAGAVRRAPRGGQERQHIQFALTDGGSSASHRLQPERDAPTAARSPPLRVAFEPILDTYNGRTSVKFQVIDVAFPE